jgi:hypothetical protein
VPPSYHPALRTDIAVPMIAVGYDAGSGFQFAAIRQPQILELPFVLDCRFSPFEHCGQLAIPTLGPAVAKTHAYHAGRSLGVPSPASIGGQKTPGFLCLVSPTSQASLWAILAACGLGRLE